MLRKIGKISISMLLLFMLVTYVQPDHILYAAETKEESQTDIKTAKSGKCGDSLTYKLDEDGVLTISGTGDMWNMECDGYGSYEDAKETPWKKERASIKKVVIKDGVTSIGQGAFLKCTNLKSVVFAKSVTKVDVLSFAECKSLTSITFTSKIKSLGSSAFSRCTSLKSVTIPATVLVVEPQVFEDCTSLTEVTIEGDKSIPADSYGYSYNMFIGCGKLEAIHVSENHTAMMSHEGVLYAKRINEWDHQILVEYPEGKTASKYTIVDGTNQIAIGAFTNAKHLTNIVFPDSVQYIYDGFAKMPKFKTLTIPKNLVYFSGIYSDKGDLMKVVNNSQCEIGVYTDGTSFWLDENNNLVTLLQPGQSMYHHTAIEEILLPSNLEVVTGKTQQLLYKVTYYYDHLPKAEDDVVFTTSSKSVLTIDKSGLMTGKKAGTVTVGVKSKYNGYSVQSSVKVASASKVKRTTVDNVVFELMDNGKVKLVDGRFAASTYTIPSKVTFNGKSYSVSTIGQKAFYEHETLKKLTMPSTITTIEDWDVASGYHGVFERCTALTTVKFSSNLKYIGTGAFHFCDALTDVVLPSKLETIMDEAFLGCKSLDALTLPASVDKVGQCAFSQSGIVSFKIPKTATKFHQLALYDISTLKYVSVESGHEDYSAKDGVLYTKGYLELVLYPPAKADTEYTLHEKATGFMYASIPFNGSKKLKKLILNDKVTVDGLMCRALLQRTNIEYIKVPSENPYLKSVSGVVYSKDGKTLYYYPPAKKDKIFFVPSGVEQIGVLGGTYTFETLKYLEEIYIPASVKKIEGIAWMSPSIKKFVIAGNSKLESLPGSMFQDCTSLQGLCLPASFKSFSDDYYGNELLSCTSMENLYVAEGAPFYTKAKWGVQSLNGCMAKMTVYGHGSSNRLSKMAAQFECKYVNVSKGLNKIIGVTFKDTEKTIGIGRKSGLGTIAYPTTTTVKGFKYVSSNPKVATVSSSGTVTGVSEGECYITATATDGSGEYARCKIKVYDYTVKNASISLSSTSYTYDGKTKKPSVKVVFHGKTLKLGTDYTVSYKNNKNIGTATVTIKGIGDFTGTVTKNFKISTKAGKAFALNGLKYKITSVASKTVSFYGLSSSFTSTSVSIPSSVTYGGLTFKVTAIAENALKGKTKITSVSIGSNVQKIGKNAFYGCSKLKTITVKSTKLTSVGSNALKGIYSSAKIKVPSSKLSAYKTLFKGKGQSSKVTVIKNS